MRNGYLSKTLEMLEYSKNQFLALILTHLSFTFSYDILRDSRSSEHFLS